MAVTAAFFGCRQTNASSAGSFNHIFVNNIVPSISSNLSGSVISIDDSSSNSKVPLPSTPSGPVFPFVPMAPVIQTAQQQQQQQVAGHDREYSIQELTKLLEMKLKRIRNQELDVPVVQVSSIIVTVMVTIQTVVSHFRSSTTRWSSHR